MRETISVPYPKNKFINIPKENLDKWHLHNGNNNCFLIGNYTNENKKMLYGNIVQLVF